MNAFLDSLGHGFESMGVHPMLGAFVLGAVIAFVFARRKSFSSDEPEFIDPPTPEIHRSHAHQLETESATSHGIAAAPSHVTPSIPSHPGHGRVKYKGQTYDFPAEAMAHIRAGNKIEAIKVLRSTTQLDLKTAKQIVDRVAALPPKH